MIGIRDFINNKLLVKATREAGISSVRYMKYGLFLLWVCLAFPAIGGGVRGLIQG